jgi:hypothetical protein
MAVECAVTLLRILQLPGSNLGSETEHPYCFPQLLQVNVQIGHERYHNSMEQSQF